MRYLNKEIREYPLQEGFDILYFDLDEKERIKNVTEDIYKFVKKQLKHYESRKITEFTK